MTQAELAQLGAKIRLQELKTEIAELEALLGTPAPRKRVISAAARRETSRRMKAYWAARRAAETKKAPARGR